LRVNDDETGVESADIIIPEFLEDLSNWPFPTIPNAYLKSDGTGGAYYWETNPIAVVSPIPFKSTVLLAKGYVWVSGVKVANTNPATTQIGDLRRGWVSNAPSDPAAKWFWMESGRYAGGATNNIASYVISNYSHLAFETDPDFGT
jgi:hypothetical protein